MTRIKNQEMEVKNLRNILAYLLFISMIVGCSQPEGFVTPEDPLDAGREFVRAVLDGDYKKASLYLNDDPEDQELFSRYVAHEKKQPRKEILSYKSASIIINKAENINDSTSIINFSNSYSMKPMDLKIIKKNNTWKVDFSYTFSGNIPQE
ncbi:MAG: hypothetical protein ACK5AO_02465 [bacterium]|jgi:hypothetical protein